MTVAQLQRNGTLLAGHWPFVLTDAMAQWPATELWSEKRGSLQHLTDLLGDEWVDFYAKNMYSVGNKPILYRLRQAAERWQIPAADDSGPSNMCLYLTENAILT